MTQEALTVFFGWATVINGGVLLVSTAMLLLLRGFVAKLHSRMFKLEERDLNKAYFQYLAQFKIVFLVFNLAPYLAFSIMGPAG